MKRELIYFIVWNRIWFTYTIFNQKKKNEKTKKQIDLLRKKKHLFFAVFVFVFIGFFKCFAEIKQKKNK